MIQKVRLFSLSTYCTWSLCEAKSISSVSLDLLALTLYVFSADQAVSETIPLSPQWLYAKPNEPKMVNLLSPP